MSNHELERVIVKKDGTAIWVCQNKKCKNSVGVRSREAGGVSVGQQIPRIIKCQTCGGSAKLKVRKAS